MSELHIKLKKWKIGNWGRRKVENRLKACCWCLLRSSLLPALRISLDDISFCNYHVFFKISLKYRYRIFFTISHNIHLISTHTESPYQWLKVPNGEAIFGWKWHKNSKYTPHKWSHTLKRIGSQKKIANCYESPEYAFRKTPTIFYHI